MSIPVVSLNDDPDTVARQLDGALRESGFVTIRDHGVPDSTIGDAWRAAVEFFALPAEEKAALVVDGPYGYSPFRAEALARSRGDETPPDLKESFNLGPFMRSHAELAALGVPPGGIVWPGQPAGFRRAWVDYYEAMDGLTMRLLEAMARALDLESSFFTPSFRRHVSALRALHYPALDVAPEPGQLRAGVHTDYGSLTILLPGEASEGLEVQTRDGSWLPVAPMDGAFVVNIGDVMQRWTNDRWVSTLHRVVVPADPDQARRERFSIAYFQNPSLEAVIEVVPSAESPRYDPVRFGDWLSAKVTAAYGS